MKDSQRKAMFAKFKPEKILSVDQGHELISEHVKQFGTEFRNDYNSTTISPNVELIFSKEQPRFDSVTNEKIKRFPELRVKIKVK